MIPLPPAISKTWQKIKSLTWSDLNQSLFCPAEFQAHI